jgi:hypothetical protein
VERDLRVGAVQGLAALVRGEIDGIAGCTNAATSAIA